jgi:2-dehydro-3-deoxyphosphogluconate aldolase/(4S)-4-hydroxy-2-oxoglutarate aldolase
MRWWAQEPCWNLAKVERVREAAARFAVSPGCTPRLITAVQAAGLPFLPGI